MEKKLIQDKSITNQSTSYDNQSIMTNTHSTKLFDDDEVVKRVFFENYNEDKLKLVSIIVTFTSDESFDTSLRSKKPICRDDLRVDVYAVDIKKIEIFVNLLLYSSMTDNINVSQSSIESIIFLKNSFQEVSKQCILFNFECSPLFKCKVSGKFGLVSKDSTLNLLKYLIDELKCHIMFSDYSLKALINDWDTEILGLKPLKEIGKVGELGKTPKEKYEKEIFLMTDNIEKSESSQIKVVRLLSKTDKILMNCLRNTIIVGLDASKLPNTEIQKTDTDNEKKLLKQKKSKTIVTKKYDFKVLTKVCNLEEACYYEEDYFLDKSSKDSIGHAYFKYESGSILFISTCHWNELELDKFEVDENKLKQFIKSNCKKDSIEIKICDNQDQFKIEMKFLASNNIISSNNGVDLTAFSSNSNISV